tara:strand:+ start:840 stop:2459 length:1620 start_codon:yes stop_codon:yes gene_type:complete
MANSTANLTVRSNDGKAYSFSSQTDYNEIYQVKQEVDNSNGFIDLLNIGTSIAAQTLRDAKMIVICNKGDTALEIQTEIQAYKNNSNADVANAVDLGGGSTNLRYINFLLPVGDFMYLPNNRMISYEGEAGVSACNATSVTDTLPHDINSNLEYVDSVANLGAHVNGTTTSINVGDTDYFKVGDLIQLGTHDTPTDADAKEFMRVIEITSSTLVEVERALFGTAAGNQGGNQTTGHASGAAVYLPFFNEFHDYDKFAKAQTDSQGRFKASNFFGYGRTSDKVSDGIVPGSVAISFYSQPSASVGMSNVQSSTESGLTGGTTYEFHIDVTGTDEDITFTVDSGNTKFGGANGIVSKIQQTLNTKFYDSSSQLFEKRVTVNLIGGDLVFRLHESLSDSAISIGRAASVSATTHLIATGTTNTGRFPGADNIPNPIAVALPRKKAYTKGFSPNVRKTDSYMTDNGHGVLSGGGGSGSINYETGAIEFTGPPKGEFTISATYKSALGGAGDGSTSGAVNVIKQISARTTSSKKDGVCEIIAFN